MQLQGPRASPPRHAAPALSRTRLQSVPSAGGRPGAPLQPSVEATSSPRDAPPCPSSSPVVVPGNQGHVRPAVLHFLGCLLMESCSYRLRCERRFFVSGIALHVCPRGCICLWVVLTAEGSAMHLPCAAGAVSSVGPPGGKALWCLCAGLLAGSCCHVGGTTPISGTAEWHRDGCVT